MAMDPCPFCGSGNVKVTDTECGDRCVTCLDCRCSGPEPASNDDSDDTDEKAVLRWNKRPESKGE